MFKFIVLLSVLGIVTCVDVNLGTRAFGKKIYDADVKASPALWKRTKVVDVSAGPREVISGIFIEDRRPKKDGVAYILKGGETQKFVSIQLKSPAIFRGYDFHVEVYSAPDVFPRVDIPALPVETDVQEIPNFEPAVVRDFVKPQQVPSVAAEEGNVPETPQRIEPAIVRDFVEAPQFPSVPVGDTNVPQIPQSFEPAVTRDIVLTPEQVPTAPLDDATAPQQPADSLPPAVPVDVVSETTTELFEIVP